MKCSVPMVPRETSHLICELCWRGSSGEKPPDDRGDLNIVPYYAPCCFCGQTTESRIYVYAEVDRPRHCAPPRQQSLDYKRYECDNAILTITLTNKTVHEMATNVLSGGNDA